MRRAFLTLLLTALAASPAAPQGGGRVFPLDRVAAVVGDRPVLYSEVLERINEHRARRDPLPADSAATVRQVLNELVDEEVLIQAAKRYGIEVTDADVAADVEGRMREARRSFNNDDAAFRAELAKAGFGGVEEFRKLQVTTFKRNALIQRAIDSLRAKGRMPPVNVTERQVEEAFEQAKAGLPRRPERITLRQVVVAPRPAPARREAARQFAESLHVEITRHKADFEALARRFSADSATRPLGGDLGWMSRRDNLVPEFESWLFRLNPGMVSPVFETAFGWHIVRVDRVQPGQVRSRQILIIPERDSTDLARARAEADSVARAWRAGAPYDTLVARHHDQREERALLEPFPRAQLPEAYRAPLERLRQDQVSDPFPLPDPSSGLAKFAVVQVVQVYPEGEATLAEMRERVRAQLVQEGSMRRVLDALRAETYVALRM
jgi:peptidyl-prolyl cis-trans isomerase SurA